MGIAGAIGLVVASTVNPLVTTSVIDRKDLGSTTQVSTLPGEDIKRFYCK